jgi:ATP-dependent Clp protease ATP-binding subunit ClpC
VKLSERYITGRFLPDKAIDVMDEAGARARINAMTRPPDVKEIEREIEEIRIEKEAAIKAQDFEKAAALRDKEKQTKDKLEGILAQWREEREEKEVLVTADDMMNIISKVTGVPLQKMEQKETAKASRNGRRPAPARDWSGRRRSPRSAKRCGVHVRT